ncbi:Cytochrome P450 [Penicillium expansum]|nr:Cytochrome P450 [Penicillium expansum]
MGIIFNVQYALVTGLFTAILYVVYTVIYNVYFHPLSRFPGPLGHKISRLAYVHKSIRGTLPFDMLEMHKRYGDIVRIAPDELAFSHPDAWQDIMGHQKGKPEFSKADWFYRPVEDSPPHAMRDQEPMIRGYVDTLLARLHDFCKSGSPVILSDWYNYTTFDIIGDLAFGEPFGCLQGSNLDGWIKGIFDAGRVGITLQALSFYPSVKRTLLSMMPASMTDAHEKHKKLTEQKMMRRMEKEEGRPDLIEGLLRKREELNLSIDKLISNAEILIIGGSETTASLLSGVTYLLLMNPTAHQKLKEEVRTVFQSQEEINLVSVNKLPYMLACLDEALRMYPPIANGLPRVCPEGGAQVLGEYVPANTFVSVHQWALYRREEYFKDPNTYHPERFLDDPSFADDRREVLQPFHTGPRNCLGRNLAYSEMRLILALIIFNFDMEIADEARDWIKQRNFLMWEKGPLKVHLTRV